jgi:hypothetical protein
VSGGFVSCYCTLQAARPPLTVPSWNFCCCATWRSKQSNQSRSLSFYRTQDQSRSNQTMGKKTNVTYYSYSWVMKRTGLRTCLVWWGRNRFGVSRNFAFVAPSVWLMGSINHGEGIAMPVVLILIIHDKLQVRSFKFGIPEPVQREGHLHHPQQRPVRRSGREWDGKQKGQSLRELSISCTRRRR